MMNYEETMKLIEEVAKLGSVPGLESIKELMKQLDNIQDTFPVLHVAGTNGKGSTCHYMASILKEAGYTVGCFMTPDVYCYEDKFIIDGDRITKEELARYYSVVEDACQKMTEKNMVHPTLFEMEVAVAFLAFTAHRVDLVILECGMGGALDATNILTSPLQCIFTPIGMDHMAFLGEDIESIALAKSGIIKEKTTVITAPQKPPVLEILQKQTSDKEGDFCMVAREEIRNVHNTRDGLVFDYKDYKKLEIRAQALYQIENASTAILACEQLAKHLSITQEHIRHGLLIKPPFGRFEQIAQKPQVYLDGAHNEPAALRLSKTVENKFTNKSIVYIIGMLKDKACERVLEIMSQHTQTVVCMPTVGERGLSALELSEYAKAYYKHIEVARDCEQAVDRALQLKPEVIICFGSLSQLKNIKDCFRKRIEE
ncbi:bifunctional folylpolyglutamate synthase/dihydrofolate synthase [Eubacterium oxidoreducens]|uniref:tetrahydrofolate synthase n=1 Tax=Eubacterium oxidoreducens TaxID=1732 RepID=A0A1G6C4F4_EUBOX|nr:Mur ligase family protein [Eubacterium oxidoreducens]SDB27740.1 dihydrofolate synthase / folylpolyglutamate synthase [Eubacterium oxidoreducens]